MLYYLLAAALVVVDQLVKSLVRANIPLGEGVPFLPHILQLTYYQNTGAAFSIFEQHTWILTLISAAASVLLSPPGLVRNRSADCMSGGISGTTARMWTRGTESKRL